MILHRGSGAVKIFIINLSLKSKYPEIESGYLG